MSLNDNFLRPSDNACRLLANGKQVVPRAEAAAARFAALQSNAPTESKIVPNWQETPFF